MKYQISTLLTNLRNIDKPTLVVVTGPTAVGKTSFTIDLASKLHCSVISADSRQFYKELRIGTAFPDETELQNVPHYFLGHLSIQDYYSVSRFEHDVLKIVPKLFQENQVVILTGGSGLYIDAVCKGIDDLPDPDPKTRIYVMDVFEKEGVEGLRNQIKLLDPLFYEQSDLANPKRLMRALEVSIQMGVPYSSFLTKSEKNRDFEILKYCLVRPREILFKRINERVDQMLRNGLLDEVKSLRPYQNLNALNTVGYKELFDYLEGKLSFEKAVEDIKTHTRRYAKRQLTWFKRDGDYQYIDIID
ncbi:MAG TPA: tRNA (adenosine(37)-N6)-dimethylallyltransferase MiaA [Bacteroidales bacterium]|nr:tRNA (adenosine(37)-N6)-dimethylallyltransferase MiaA [Bacteroidales bacterium]